MAETTADVRRDIELTRERMSSTLAQLEHKMNLAEIVKDNPWPALALAVGAGVLLSGSRADMRAAAATVAATKGASSRMGTALDELVGSLMTGVTHALQGHVDGLVEDVKRAIGAPPGTFADASGTQSAASAMVGALAGDGARGAAGTGQWAPHSASTEHAQGVAAPGERPDAFTSPSRAD